MTNESISEKTKSVKTDTTTNKDVQKSENNTSNLSDEEIRNIVKYNQDGKEIKDKNYVDFIVERYKDRINISNIETHTKNVESLLTKTLEEAKRLVGTENENKLRNKQKELMIKELFKDIESTEFTSIKKLQNEDGFYETKKLNLEISIKGLKESFNKSISNEKYAVVPFLDKLIKTSNDGIIRSESKDRRNIDEWYYLYNTAIIDNKLYSVKIDIKKTGQGDKFYVHRLKIINEGIPISESIFEYDTIGNNDNPSNNTSISQKIKSVKTGTTNNKDMHKIETIYRKFSKEFQEKGYIDLNNKKINNIQEVADIAQVFRNPNYETFRILYTKGNTIVGQEAISSRIPGQTKVFEDNNRTKGFYKIKDRMNRLNADGYYMIHNHPTGKAVASQIDINTTQEFTRNVIGFKGHVIVNSGTYAVIEREKGLLSKLIVKNEVPIENYTPDTIDKFINKESPWFDIQIKSNNQIATLMHDVKNNPNYSTLILADSKSYTRIALDIPNSFFNMKTNQIDGYIKNIAKQNGAVKAFIATTNNEVYKSAKKLTTITDSMLYFVEDNEIYQEDTLSKEDKDITEHRIFNKKDLKVKNNNKGNVQHPDSNIRQLKQTARTNIEHDNLGRKLSKQQQEYFKDSKVIDEDGNLLTVFHGSNSEFTIFDLSKSGQASKESKIGFWFTETKEGAENFANSLWYGDNKAKSYETYLNIRKPKVYNSINNSIELENIDNRIRELKNIIRKLENKNIAIEINKGELRWANENELADIAKYEGIDLEDAKRYHNAVNEYNKLEKDYDNKKYNDSYEKFRSDIYAVAGKSASDANFGGTGMWLENENEIISKFKQKLIDEGYDGIIIRNTKYDSDTMGRNNNQYVAFYPEQIKNVDNTNPTDNPDIRYLKKKKNNSNILENYDELTSNRIKMNTRNVVIENSNQLNNLIDEALTTNKNKALHLGKLNAEIVSKIKNNIQNLPQSKLNLLNKDTYDLVINQSEIRHLIDDKSTLSNNDIKHFIKVLPEIIANSDYVSYTNNLKDEGLRFKKLMEDGTYVSFVIVSNKQGTMKVKTIYMEKGDYENKKRSISPSNNANEIALDNTSETNGAFASTTSIAQNPENVNTSKKTSKVEDGLTNSERADAYIEQEIKKVEATGKWDNSIPVTRRTDIRKTIEDYLGIGIQKGHFRQRAYGIYNTKTDSIRTKELKDMDSILHEVGHALDLGNRLEIDKESIADELLKAINKYGGYEGNPRSVLLDEGWAEVIREYAIIPEQAKAEYPQSVAVLEELRKADKDFDNFIGKVQEQIYNYIHQNPQNRVLSNMSIGEQTDKKEITPKTIKENIVKLVWDKDYALKATVEEFAKANGRAPTPSENAYLLARLASGVQTKAISMISDGYINEKGETMIPGLSKLGDILGNNPERFNDLRSFLVAQRDLDYKAKTLKTGIRTMDSQAVIKQFEKDTQIQRAAKIVHNTLDGVLTYAVDNGLITRVDADQIRQSNAFYVPMQRVLENRNNQVGRRGAVSDIIKSRTGSELDIKDVLENIVVNSTNIIQQVENNSVLRALYKQGDEAGMKNNVFEKIPAPMQKVGTAQLSTWEKELQKQGIDTNKIDFEKTIDIFAPNNKIDTKNRITSFIDEKGNRVYLQFSDEVLFNTIMNLDKNTNSMFLKIMRNMNMPLKYGATMANVGFALPNMISDTVQAAIFSEAGFIPVVDNALGVLDILTASNKTVANFMKQVAPEYANRINRMYTLYEQSGASSSTRLSQYRKSSQELMRDVYGTKNSETLGIKESFKPLKRLLDIMTYIPEISEQSTRFKVFEKNYEAYRKKGGTELDARIKAAIESRDATQDFGRTGTLMKEVNQLIPFSAARVGSAYTFVEKVKANPKRTVARIAVLTAVAMAIKAIGYDDKEIEELNQRKKDDNFVFKIGDSIITIKKPQGILRSIVNLAEYIQDLATGHIEEGKEGERLGEWINNAIMDNMPADSITGLVPNAFAPLIENAINKDFYYNTDIVKSYDLDLPDSEQYYDYNSQLAILLGQIFNYSPAKIDNLISGYFGGLGTQVTDTIDWISGKLGLSAEEPAMGAEENAIGKRFVVNVNTNSASIDEIYDRKTELTKKKNGGTITDEETEELEKITEAISNISSLNKQIKEIKQSLTISAEQKAVQIKDLQKQKTDTARQALGKDLIYSDTADKIESTKFYPSRDTLSSNGYSLTLTSSMKKEYEKLAYEKYKQYEKQGLYSEEYLEKLETQAKDYAKQTLIKKYKSKLVKTK